MGITRIRLTGYIDVPPDRRADIAAALPEHIRTTRAEPGCLSFDVDPDPAVAGRYTVSELFASRADFEEHQRRIVASAWGRISDGIARHYDMAEVPG